MSDGFLGAYDLIVVGGGAAGSAAAITAGRLGLHCLLVEQLSFLGGTGVAAQVTPWMSNHIEMGALNEGLSAELQRDLEATGDASGYAINPEALKGLLERKAVAAGVTLLYEAVVVGVKLPEPTPHPSKEGNNGVRLPSIGGAGGGLVPTLTIATRHGLSRATARTIIDCTGDAHVAHLAGVPSRSGRESDGVHQPMSLRFVLGNVDLPSVRAHLDGLGDDMTYATFGPLWGHTANIHPFFHTAIQKDNWPAGWIKTFTIQFGPIAGRPHELWFNCPRLTGFDPLDPLSLSAAYVEGRRMIDAYLQLFRNHVNGAQDAFLVAVAPLMGIREGRRIIGKYTLTGDDFRQRRKFADGICLNRYPIDIHNPHGQGLAEWTEMTPGDWHEIPYRCLVPEGARGLLVAGRCISSDFTAQASFRIIPNCRTMGEAAGVAAGLAQRDGCDVAEVDGRQVRAEMLERGLLPRWAETPAPVEMMIAS